MSREDGRSDGELAALAAAGDHRAYAVLVSRHKEGLYRFARRYVGDADAAYEAAQETFVAAWSALPRYDPVRRPFAVWISAIALNKCRDRARRATVRRLIFGDRHLDSPEAAAQSDPSPDAEADLIRTQRLRALDRAIAGLPQNLKEPLLLTQFEGLSQIEAARMLGLTVKAVETRVRRARERLRDDLNKGQV